MAASCCAVFNSDAACSFLYGSYELEDVGVVFASKFAELRVPSLDIIIGALLVLPIGLYRDVWIAAIA